MEYNKIIQGNSLEVLKTLPDESVNCVVTSPPYYGLRDYGENAYSIWDELEPCEHEWEEEITKRPNASGGYTNKEYKDSARHFVDYSNRKTKSQFCKQCNAWYGQLGLEPNINLYIKHLCDIFDEIKRILTHDGTCFVNLGDSYAGGNGQWDKDNRNQKGNENNQLIDTRYKHQGEKNSGIRRKSLCLIPFRFAIEMVDNRGWILRNTIIWYKCNQMPSSAKDRFTPDFEYIYFFTKNENYYFEQQFEPMSESTKERDKYQFSGAFKNQYLGSPVDERWQDGRPIEKPSFYNEKGRNKRCVWSIPTKSYKGAHFAVYPTDLIEPMIKAGCPKNGVVYDPFMGSGTTAIASLSNKRKYLGSELNTEYIELAEKRIKEYINKNFVKLKDILR